MAELLKWSSRVREIVTFLPGDLVQVSNLSEPQLLHPQNKKLDPVSTSQAVRICQDKQCVALSHSVCSIIKAQHACHNHFIHELTALQMFSP
jgi:hypothetical protein